MAHALRSPVLLALPALLLAACSTQRTLTITSDPPGATVWVDGVERGKTPVSLPFVYYGDAEVRLEKEGYESVATVLEVPTQIDGYPFVDLPFELTVRRRCFSWNATLARLGPDPSEPEIQDLIGRADAFRERTRREADASRMNAPLGGERPPCPEAAPVEAPPPLVRPVGGGR